MVVNPLVVRVSASFSRAFSTVWKMTPSHARVTCGKNRCSMGLYFVNAPYLAGGDRDVEFSFGTLQAGKQATVSGFIQVFRTDPHLLPALVFQSRFGRAEWLKPYAVDTVAAAPSKGVKNLVVIMPGFAADCVETLEEVAIGLRETFLANGGENFATVPCLNDSPNSIAMLARIARNELQGWI